MKKLLSVLTACALLLSLTSCAAIAASLSSSAHPSPTLSRTPAPHPTFKVPYPTVSSYVPNTDIPDVDFSGEHETAVKSGYIYENENDIYYADYAPNSFVRISKADFEIYVIEPECSKLTSYNGMLYYVGVSGNFVDDWVSTIIRYDPQTGKKENVISQSYGIYDITAYNDKIYYLYSADPNNYYYHLYAVNLDGADNQLIKKMYALFASIKI